MTAKSRVEQRAGQRVGTLGLKTVERRASLRALLRVELWGLIVAVEMVVEMVYLMAAASDIQRENSMVPL